MENTREKGSFLLERKYPCEQHLPQASAAATAKESLQRSCDRAAIPRGRQSCSKGGTGLELLK